MTFPIYHPTNYGASGSSQSPAFSETPCRVPTNSDFRTPVQVEDEAASYVHELADSNGWELDQKSFDELMEAYTVKIIMNYIN